MVDGLSTFGRHGLFALSSAFESGGEVKDLEKNDHLLLLIKKRVAKTDREKSL